MDEFLNRIYEQVKAPKELALGYPVNREHAFNIDLEAIGIISGSLSNTFMNNVGSPYSPKIFSIDDIRELEQYVINTIFSHLNGNQVDGFGYITSGGTEGNFAGVWWHREYLTRVNNRQPVLISSNKSHYSLDKIANQLQLELVKLDSNNLVKDLSCYLNINPDKPIIFWANIGATVDGTIDDLSKIKDVLDANAPNKYKIHADGAIYGLLIPYIEKLKHIKNIFSIIDSISISGHKFLGAYNICGVVLARKSYLDQVFNLNDKAVSYVRNAIDCTVSGSRPGFHIVELYLLLNEALKVQSNGKSNLEILWLQCLDIAKWFYLELRKILNDNQLLWFNPYQLSILVPAPKNESVKFNISKKYSLMPVGATQLGIYVLPRSTKEKLNKFLQDYVACEDIYHHLDSL